MTKEQGKAIIEYRKNGCSYGQISQLTGIKATTVKAFCQRSGVGGVAAKSDTEDEALLCMCCGARLVRLPGRKPRKFCSDACRNTWWNGHLDQVNRKANYEFVCQKCGKPFTAYGNAHRKYCCHACYIEDRFGVRRFG